MRSFLWIIYQSMTEMVKPVHVKMCVCRECVYVYAGPRILQFPANIVRVVEGERVEFTVKVTGSPEPKLTWYHEGEEVMTNYSTDVGLDGCLSIPCTESSHTGLYQLVAVNPAGRAERQVTLFVRKEEQPTQQATENNKVSLSSVPVLDFEEYVASGHANDNAIFQEQFNVREIIIQTDNH